MTLQPGATGFARNPDDTDAASKVFLGLCHRAEQRTSGTWSACFRWRASIRRAAERRLTSDLRVFVSEAETCTYFLALLRRDPLPVNAGSRHRLAFRSESVFSISVVRVVQEILGHSDIRVTEGYTHVASSVARDAAERMGAALWGE